MTILNMTLSSESKTPLYRQIADNIAAAIEQGEISTGSKLPTHRALADQLQVTVGTVTRAYAEAERRHLVEARIGAGTYVCDSRQSNSWVYQIEEVAPNECNFGYNIPPRFDRSDMLSQAMANISANPAELNEMMLYQPPEGIEKHRQITSQWLNQQGIAVSPELMYFTSGAQHAAELLLSTFCRAGDTVLVEHVCYPGFLTLAKQHGITVKGVEMDESGVCPRALASACQLYQPRLIYLTPTQQNPTSITMPLSRREAVISVCKQHDLLIAEDDINGLLPLSSPPPLINLAPEQVIHIGGLSKCLAPGLRLGYIQAPKQWQPHLSAALYNHSLMISPLLSAIACELITQGQADQVLDTIRNEIEQRQNIVQSYLGEFAITTQKHSFHVWLKLPDYWRLTDFITAAEQHNVIVKSAEHFTPPGGTIMPAVRLAISSPTSQQTLIFGLEILADLLRQPPMTSPFPL
ncbi:aminotransferase-like domain-containing protein [Photobacterium leiognathi]|uniref:aminotransferase-like domain-containing protein n=1 Tax=Photobacterium leiognathi TaxID=553611 RepID=UPI002982920D|nr:PLP-dependent aminotransferase family protein [Photobacterium leiognathi]